jgi:hypothetical protein
VLLVCTARSGDQGRTVLGLAEALGVTSGSWRDKVAVDDGTLIPVVARPRLRWPQLRKIYLPRGWMNKGNNEGTDAKTQGQCLQTLSSFVLARVRGGSPTVGMAAMR